MEEYIQVTLVTKSPNYGVPSYPLSVPTSSTSAELNKLLKDLLKESSGCVVQVEFVFIIQNEYLLTSIAEHLQEKQLTFEQLEIEYCEKQKAPVFSDEIKQDDLISSVKRLNEFVLTGSYDRTVQIWTVNNPKALVTIEQEDEVKCVEWLSFDNRINHQATFVSGGFGQTAKIWSWNMKTNEVTCVAVCRGHSETVMTAAGQSLGVDAQNADLFATGSFDGTLKVWSASTGLTDLSEETGGIAHVRKSKDKIPTRVPRLTLAGHRDVVTRVCWLPTSTEPSTSCSQQLISVSWDHSLRVWDCQVKASAEQNSIGGSELRSIVAAHAIHDADAALQGILTASSDNRVRIYDLRAQEALSLVGFQGHTAWLTSVAWAPHRDNQFVTGSIDRSVRLWDTRNIKASLFDLIGHTDMVTDVDWARPIEHGRTKSGKNSATDQHLILSSSADGTVKIYCSPE